MQVTADGKVTIPPHIREWLGLTPDTEVKFTEVEFWVEGDALYLRRADPDPSTEHREPGAPYPGKGAELVARLRGKATTTMTTDEIMRLTRGED